VTELILLHEVQISDGGVLKILFIDGELGDSTGDVAAGINFEFTTGSVHVGIRTLRAIEHLRCKGDVHLRVLLTIILTEFLTGEDTKISILVKRSSILRRGGFSSLVGGLGRRLHEGKWE